MSTLRRAVVTSGLGLWLVLVATPQPAHPVEAAKCTLECTLTCTPSGCEPKCVLKCIIPL